MQNLKTFLVGMAIVVVVAVALAVAAPDPSAKSVIPPPVAPILRLFPPDRTPGSNL